MILCWIKAFSLKHCVQLKLYRGSMKRFFSPVASAASPAEKKPRRVFNPVIALEESTSTPSAAATSSETITESKVSPSVPSIASLLATETPAHVIVLNKAQQNFAKSAPSNQWIEYPGIIAKLRTSLQPTTALKGILAFDIDGTIITTKSGKKFPVDDADWKFWHPSVPEILREKSNEGYSIAFISNQGGVGSKKQSAQGFQKKIDAIIHKIGVPIDFICSLQGDVFRKPCTGMWEFLQFARWESQIQHSTSMSMLSTTGAGDDNNIVEKLYIGDAAGRPATGTHSKDFSDTDLKLSINLGVQFQTPEKFFLQSTQSVHNSIMLPSSLPSTRLSDWGSLKHDELHGTTWTAVVDSLASSATSKEEILLIVAPPASGKSTLARALVQKYAYTRINQDELGNFKKCLQAAKDAIACKKSLVIDNTNLNKETRFAWIELAKESNYKIRCVNIKLPKELCMLLSTYRLIHPATTDNDRRKIETVVFHKYFKELEYAVESEGFYRVDTIGWVPMNKSTFDEITLRLYTMYLK